MGILEVRDLCKSFGGLRAISDVNFDITKGELFSIIGPNGAGKSTIFNVLTGFLKPTKGEIFFEGQNICRCTPDKIVKKGMSRTFQATTIFKDQTVMDNVLISHHMRNDCGLINNILATKSARKCIQRIREESLNVLKFFGLLDVKDELSMNLSHGSQRKLQVSMALSTQPKMLLLDEPLVGMNAEETDEMMRLIKRLQIEKDVTVVLVEHNMRAVMSYSDRIMVIDFGTKIAEGNPKEIQNNQQVVDAYLGAENDA